MTDILQGVGLFVLAVAGSVLAIVVLLFVLAGVYVKHEEWDERRKTRVANDPTAPDLLRREAQETIDYYAQHRAKEAQAVARRRASSQARREYRHRRRSRQETT